MPETTGTPSGDYPRPAPVHQVDLEEEAARLASELPGHRRRGKNIARESGVSLVMMVMDGGDEVQQHRAEGVVTVHLLRGRVTLNAQGESHELRGGQLVLMQPGVPHDLAAHEQSVVLLTVTALRTS